MVLPTERKSLMNSGELLMVRPSRFLLIGATVVWLGKIAGCFLFEPLSERVGFKKTIYVVSSIQILAIISKRSPLLFRHR
jgi:hypothetical protein